MPVLEYDSLMFTKPGVRSYVYDVPPRRAPAVAALYEVRDAMLEAAHKVAEFKPKITKLSKRHKAAYRKYQESIPASERCALWAGSLQDGIDAAIKVLEARLCENDKLHKSQVKS
jgi:hypothetical protein